MFVRNGQKLGSVLRDAQDEPGSAEARPKAARGAATKANKPTPKAEPKTEPKAEPASAPAKAEGQDKPKEG